MGWDGGGGGEEISLADRQNASVAQADFKDWHENYRPLVGEYLDENTATEGKRAAARGVATADVGQAYKGAPTAATTAGYTNGVGGSSRVTSQMSGMLDSKARDVGIGRNTADMAKRRQELQARLKAASLGRDLSSDINSAANNSASGITRSKIADMDANRPIAEAAISGIGTIAGAYVAKQNFKPKTEG